MSVNPYYLGVPEGFALGLLFLCAIWLVSLLLRLIYYQSTSNDLRLAEYQYDTTTLLTVCGLRYYIALCFLSLIVTSVMFVSVDQGAGSVTRFFSIKLINKTWWCVIQTAMAALALGLAYEYVTHPLFRCTSIAVHILMSLLNLISHVSNNEQIACVNRGLCVYSERVYVAYARDCVGCILSLMLLMLSAWLTGLCGFFLNHVYLVREEHRRMSLHMEKVIGQRKKAKRKDDNQMAQMMGF